MDARAEQWLLQEKYAGVESFAFHADLKRLEAGEPLAYVIGHIPFLGCTIYLDSQPLIPRVETEFWVEKAITEIKKITAKTAPQITHSTLPEARPREGVSQTNFYPARGRASGRSSIPGVTILDLCAGSGAIGVAVAKAIPNSHVTFGEIDSAHLPTITHNLSQNDIDCTRYRVYQADLFTPCNPNPTSSSSELELGTYDVILCNPPYIDSVLDRTEQSVAAYEPAVALYGGVAGMEVIEKIIADSPAHLHTHGQLWLEHEPEQSALIATLASTHGFTCVTHTDQYEVERYSCLVLQ